MSSTFLDAGDIQRMDVESRLTEQAPRVLPEEDRSPDDPMNMTLRDLMMQSVMEQLERRFS